MITQPELIRALVLGGGPVGAAAELSCSRVTVWRMARRYGLRIERERVLASPAAWERVYQAHGSARGIARALGMDPTYVHRQLQGHGLIPTPGAAVEEDVA
mgnify:FL=1